MLNLVIQNWREGGKKRGKVRNERTGWRKKEKCRETGHGLGALEDETDVELKKDKEEMRETGRWMDA